MITQSRLKELFHYCPESGLFTCLIPTRRYRVGDVAGYKSDNHYIKISSDGKSYLAHRLAWLYTHGKFPKNQIDHINGVRYDNRLFNLRDVSNNENHRNQKFHKNNTSGVMGVAWHKSANNWVARIAVDGKKRHLGSFLYKFNAICARKSAENKYGYHENHGRKC